MTIRFAHRRDFGGGSEVAVTNWQLRGLCRGNHAHLFFPPSTFERKDERQRREIRAKSICQVCPVQSECVEYALDIREPYGIWGGLTESDRRQAALVG